MARKNATAAIDGMLESGLPGLGCPNWKTKSIAGIGRTTVGAATSAKRSAKAQTLVGEGQLNAMAPAKAGSVNSGPNPGAANAVSKARTIHRTRNPGPCTRRRFGARLLDQSARQTARPNATVKYAQLSETAGVDRIDTMSSRTNVAVSVASKVKRKAIAAVAHSATVTLSNERKPRRGD